MSSMCLPLLSSIFVRLMQVMMLNDKIRSLSALQSSLRKAGEYLLTVAPDTPYSAFNHRYFSSQQCSQCSFFLFPLITLNDVNLRDA